MPKPTNARSVLKKILVPVDGSESSHQAEEVAARIAKKTGAEVTIVHVIPSSILYMKLRSAYRVTPDLASQLIAHVEDQAEKVLSDADEFFVKQNVPVKTINVKFNDVPYSILRLSNRGFDLVVIGNRGGNERDPYGLGSVTRKVVRHSRVPVLVVKSVSNLSRIVVCIDGSKESVNALNYAIRLAEVMDSEITLLNVQEPQLRDLSTQCAQELGERILSRAVRATRKKELKTSQRIECGHPQDVIVETAEKEGYDLIAMASLGLGSIKRFLLGSVTDDVTQGARCSVLVVTPKD